MANQLRGQQRLEHLQTADGKLICLRAFLRYAHDLELLGAQLAGKVGFVLSSRSAVATLLPNARPLGGLFGLSRQQSASNIRLPTSVSGSIFC